jgi:heptosyltransferase-3
VSVISHTSKNILVFRTGQLGDTIVSLPAIQAIRDLYPEHRLVLLTPVQRDSNLVSPLDLLAPTKLFSEILYYKPPSAGFRSWTAWIALGVKLRRLKPEAFFYLRDYPHRHVFRDKVFFKVLAGIKTSYGLEASKYHFGARDTSGKLLRFPTEVERLLDIVNGNGQGGAVSNSVKFAIPNSDNESSRVNSLWREMAIRPCETVIGFGPGSKMPAKRWPLDRFIEVAKRVCADYPQSRLIVFGGREDFRLGEDIRKAIGRKVVNVAGELTVLESAEALRRCSVYVGNDTGVMHLAAAVGTPCVAIFSSRDHPGRWEPIGNHHIVLRKDPPCAGCLLDVCTLQAMKCLKDITVEEVVSAVKHVLKSARRAENPTVAAGAETGAA